MIGCDPSYRGMQMREYGKPGDQMSERMRNSLLNVTIQLLANIAIPLIGFFRIRLLVLNYGSDMNGIVQIFTQLMGYLQLTQMGFGSSFIVALYKPVADNDIEKINKIYNANAFFQRCVALVMFVLAALSFLYLPLFIQDDILPMSELFVMFVCFSLPYIVYQLCNAKLMLIRSMQQEYKFYRVSECLSFIRLLTSLVLIQSVDFFTYLILDSFMFLLVYGIAFFAVHQTIKPLINMTREKDITPARTAKFVVFQNISTMITQSTDTLVISHFMTNGTALVSVYNAYMYIVTTIDAVCNSLVMSLVGSFGNLLVSEESYVMHTFKQILIGVGFFASVICTSVFFGAKDFVLIWMEGTDRSYDLGQWICALISLLLFYRITRLPFELVLSSKNLFKMTTPGYVITSIVNLALSVILVQRIGVIGAMVGTVVAYYGCDLVSKAYCVVKYGMSGDITSFFKIYMFMFVSFILCVLLLHPLYQYDALNFSGFIVKMVQTTLVSAVLFFALYFVVFAEFRSLIRLFMPFVKHIFHKEGNSHD